MKKGVIFVSHSSKDRDQANAAVSYLEQLGYACWIAPRDIDAGSDYPSQITGAIRGCAALLLIMSSNANASEPVSSEVSLAYSFKKDVIALRIADVAFSKKLNEIFSRPMHLTYCTYRVNAFEDFRKGLEELSDLLKLLNIEKGGVAHRVKRGPEPDGRPLPVDAASDLHSYRKEDYKIFGTWLFHCENAKRGTAVVPSGVTTIFDEAFSNCTHLTKIVLPATVKKVGKNVFESCSMVEEIVLPSSLKKIGQSAFGGCIGLTTLILPDSLCHIGMNAFEGCSALETLNFPSRLKNIPWFAFETCRSIKSAMIPDSVKHIGMGAFSGCSSLSELRLPNTLGRVGAYTFFECKSLREVNVPTGVKKLGRYSFGSCENLERVVLPDGLKKIGKRAFYLDKNLKELTIPSSVKHISREAFAWCGALTRVTLPARFEKKCKSIFGVVAEKIEFVFI